MIPRLGGGNWLQHKRFSSLYRLENDSPSRGRKPCNIFIRSLILFQCRLENDSPSRGRKHKLPNKYHATSFLRV